MDDPILEYSILDAVHANDGSLTQRIISKKIGRSVASVNFALRLLAVKGYIKISGANPKNLKYHLTPSGVLQKFVLAYNFLKRQRALYDEVRTELLGRLRGLAREGVVSAAVYGWTPFTEAAILFLISEGIHLTDLYVYSLDGVTSYHGIPVRLIDEFQADCDVLVLMEPLPAEDDSRITTRKEACFPAE
ncbi:MAG: winged helix-turn-helix transcriptional regulator [Deltaproteobacteria bacterium]|nr:winged helix-turn-helix transcriptional regulator [Deltaproteobacteria bacterium]